MKLSIVIVSYNVKDYLVKCLKSIFKTKGSVEVIVVDNNSYDGSCAAVEKGFPQVSLIKLKKNLGFGAANNLGAKKSSGDIIFFLNSDTLVPRGSLGKLCDFFAKNPHLGVVGPKVVLPNGQVQPYSFGSDINLITLVKDKFFQEQPKAQTKKVDWVTGAALAISRKAFEATGGFDEHFFMYFEDNDLCIRTRQAGFEIYLDADSEIIHYGGKSVKSNQQRSELYFQSQDYFFYKHYGWPGKILVKLLRLPYLVFKNRS